MAMLVDCQTCPVRDVHCADCVVTALGLFSQDRPGHQLSGGAPGQPAAGHGTDVVPLDRAERRAISILLAAGLVGPEAADDAVAVPDHRSTGRGPRGRRAAG